jgi:solute carrier family 25 carnitine/acylcarnitine transporter 20/29
LSIPRLAAQVVHEEGLGGLWRGFPYVPLLIPHFSEHNNGDAYNRLPLITISIVRTISFTMYTSTKRILNSSPTTSTTSSRKGKEREVEAPWVDLKLGMFNGNSAKDVAVTSLLAGGASGAVVCVGSAPFELVKVGPPPSLFVVLILLS